MRRAVALTLATLAQGGLLWMTAIQPRPTAFAVADTPGLPVWLASPRVLRLEPRSGARAVKHKLPPGAAAATAVTFQPSPIPSAAGPTSASGPAAGPVGAGLEPGVASTLRGGLLGCANAAALGLSETERAACRDRLAAGAVSATYRPGISTAKRAYYDAVVDAETRFRNDPLGGHPPALLCGPFAPARLPPHAVEVGPCYIEPPQGSLDVDVDVPEVASQPGSPPPPR